MQQLLTQHQSLYYAWQLTRRAAGNSMESLAPTLVDSQLTLIPIRLRRLYSPAQIRSRVASSWLTKWGSVKPLRPG